MSSLLSGMVWSAAATITSRIAAFAAQIVLGTVLAKEDYAVYGIALSLSALLSALKGGGTQQVLIQRGAEYERLAPILTFISLVFNIIAGFALVGIGFWMAHATKLPQLPPLIVLMAVTGVISSFALALQGKLAIDQKFSRASLVTGAAGVGRHLMAMLLGLFGLGVLCFAIPIVTEMLLMLGIAYLFVRRIPTIKRPSWTEFKVLFRDTHWVMISSLAVSMSLYGQFLFVGFFVDKSQLGIFVFATQLVQSVAILLVVGINDVIFPRMANMRGDHDKNALYIGNLAAATQASLALGCVAIALSAPIMKMVWGAKWEDAIILVQILSVLIPTNTVCTVLCAVLASQSQWWQRTALLFAYATGDILAISLAGTAGDLLSICASLAVMRIAVSVAGIHVLFRDEPSGSSKPLACQISLAGYLIVLGAIVWRHADTTGRVIALDYWVTLPLSLALGFFFAYRTHRLIREAVL